MIKAILFDYGGVFIASQFAAIDEVARDMGVDPGLLQRVTFGDYTEDSQHPWHRLERGEISLDQAREGIIEEGRRQRLDTDIYQMLARFAGVDKRLNMPLIEKLHDWKQRGYRLGMITNNIREFTSWKTAFPFVLEEMFEVVADSSQLGFRKPSAAIYHHTLQVLGLRPPEALFLDDYPANIAGAQAVGMKTILVGNNVDQVLDEIENVLQENKHENP